MDDILISGLEVSLWLQQTYPQLREVMLWVSRLGIFEFYLALILFIYWTVDKRAGRNLAYIMATGFLLTNALKHIFRGPRPFWLGENIQIGETAAYGIPSGHVTSATITYIYLANWIRRRWFWVLAIFIILLMSLSRVYLGQHYLQDVAGGYLLAGFVLGAFALWRYRVRGRFKEMILGQQYLVAIGFPILLVGLYAVAIFFLGDPDTSVDWVDFIAPSELVGYEDVASSFAILLGLGAGFVLEPKRVRFLVAAPAWKRIVRYFLGLTAALLLLTGLRTLFAEIAPSETLVVLLSLRFLRYLIVSLWVSFYAPALFVFMKLADAAPEPELKVSINRLLPKEDAE